MEAGPKAIEALAKLVSFDTTSARSNLDLVDFVRSELATHGVQSHLVFDQGGQKAALHAILGPSGRGGLALSAHTDCVPVTGQTWSADPFTMRRQGGRLIGRGTVDMKGFLACAMASVPGLLRKGLKQPIHLCLSFDEETTFAGAPLLVGSLPQQGPPPAFCVVGEPTVMAPVVAHKGYASWDVSVIGRTGHSSRTTDTANALEAAAEAVAWLRRKARRLAASGRRVPGFEPSWTTVHTGMFRSGTILNIVPDRADFAFEVRSVPGDDARAIVAALEAHLEGTVLAELRPVASEAAIRFSPRCWAPPLALPATSPLLAMAQDCGARGGPARAAYGTEAGIFQQAGIDSIVCGPGDVAQAHQPDEWIDEAEMIACCAFIDRLGDRLAA